MKEQSLAVAKILNTQSKSSSGHHPASEPQIGDKKCRADARVNSQLPVQLNGVEGKSRDISASGIYFEIDESNDIGSTIQFSVELDTPGGVIHLVCEGEVVRLEKRDGKLGIAAKILSQELKSA